MRTTALVFASISIVCSGALAQEKKDAHAPHQQAAPDHGKAAHEHAQAPHDHGWTVLFDGSNADNFRGYKKPELPPCWTVVDGTLHFAKGTGSGNIITKEQYDNFELTFEWKVSEGGNSGVMYRVAEIDGEPYLTGPEYQILDNKKHNDGKKAETSAAACYGLYACSEDVTKPAGEWNTAKLVVNGDHVEHWLNGKKVVEYTLGSDDWNTRIAASKFKDWKQFGKMSKGHIAFQDHGDDVWYRNIKIKKLEPKK